MSTTSTASSSHPPGGGGNVSGRGGGSGGGGSHRNRKRGNAGRASGGNKTANSVKGGSGGTNTDSTITPSISTPSSAGQARMAETEEPFDATGAAVAPTGKPQQQPSRRSRQRGGGGNKAPSQPPHDAAASTRNNPPQAVASTNAETACAAPAKSGGGHGKSRQRKQHALKSNKSKPAKNDAPSTGSVGSNSSQTADGNKGKGSATSDAIKKREAEEQQVAAAEAERERLELEQQQQAAAETARRLQEQQQQQQQQYAAALHKWQAWHQARRQAVTVLQQQVLNVAQQHARHRTAAAPDALKQYRASFEANKKLLKTDLKKCTAFVKRIKTGAAWSSPSSTSTITAADSITADVSTLNLSRYVEEVVSAITESKPKVADIPVVLALCMAMHMRYPEFITNLLPRLWSVLLPTTSSSISGNHKVSSNSANAGVVASSSAAPTSADAAASDSKLRRTYMRLVTELVLAGIIVDTKQLVKCLGEAVGATNKDGNNNNTTIFQVQDAHLVVAFCKAAGFEILACTSRSIQNALQALEEPPPPPLPPPPPPDVDLSSGPNETIHGASDRIQEPVTELIQQVQDVLGKERAVAPEVSDTLRHYSLGAYQTLSHSLVQTHSKLIKLEKRCEQDRLLSGTLTDAREKTLQDARHLKESLEKSVEILADVLNQVIPVLQPDEDDDLAGTRTGLEIWTKGDSASGTGANREESFWPFDDEETRLFYCDVPDYLTTIPPALLGLTVDDIEQRRHENITKYGMIADENADATLMEEGDGTLEETGTSMAGSMPGEADGEEEQSTARETGVGATGNTENIDPEENKNTPHYKLMVLLEQDLPECHRREQIDEVSEKFCTNHGSSKNSRKRLQKILFLVPRSRMDLLPFYSRMAAALDRIWPDVGNQLVNDLEQQFHGQAKFKKNQDLDSRMKTARYIGELIKFRVAPPIVLLRCLQRCLEDFTGTNVEVACCLLEACGRFLFRMKHTNARLPVLMDTMSRLSKAKNLDDRLQSLLKAAFYTVKPPLGGTRRCIEEYPPLESYLRHLLLVRLEPTEASIALTTKQMARLPWSDSSVQCGALVCKLLLKACRKGRYKTIQAVASVAAGVRTQRSGVEITIRLIDAVLEELRWAIECPNFRDQQRILIYARLLGEIYCANQVSFQLILDQLYDFINIGHEITDALREASKKYAAAAAASEASFATQARSLPVYNSAGGVAQVIREDEEVEATELETKREESPAAAPPKPVAVSTFSKYDPRVPCLTDPPHSSYRVKLVCTLLEVAAKTLITRNNLPRMKGFMAAFQRYLFTKTMLPADVEFSLLDLFDVMDSHWRRVSTINNNKPNQQRAAESSPTKESGFPRFSTWVDAHVATLAMEESEALYEAQKKARVEAILDESRSVGSEVADPMDGRSLNDDSNSVMEEDEDDDDDDSASASAMDSITEAQDEDVEAVMDEPTPVPEEDDFYQSGASEMDEESDFESDDDENDDDDEGDDEEFDEEAYMRQLEEEAFDQELRKITADALEKGKNASRKLVADNMPSGSQIIRRKPGEQVRAAEATGESQQEQQQGNIPAFALGGKAGISFQLLKKGNKGKVEAKELIVPVDTNLAQVATKQDDEAARERDVIKQRVLQYEAVSAEAEFSNVYLELEKLPVIRNRPLSMEVIDRNFGTTGGQRFTSKDRPSKGNESSNRPNNIGGRTLGHHHIGGGGRGRGRGRGSSGGRTLFG